MHWLDIGGCQSSDNPFLFCSHCRQFEIRVRSPHCIQAKHSSRLKKMRGRESEISGTICRWRRVLKLSNYGPHRSKDEQIMGLRPPSPPISFPLKHLYEHKNEIGRKTIQDDGKEGRTCTFSTTVKKLNTGSLIKNNQFANDHKGAFSEHNFKLCDANW